MSLKKNITANYLGEAWAALMSLAFVPVYIRYLGMEAYGLIGVFVLLQAWLAFLDLGMTPTLNREMARFTAGAHTPQGIRNLLRSLEIVCASVAALIALVLWASSDYLANHWLNVDSLRADDIARALAIMAATLALRFCEGIYRGSLLGLQRQVLYNALNAGLATVRHGGAAVVLAWISPRIDAFFAWQAAVSLLAMAVMRFAVFRSLPEGTSRPRFVTGSLLKVWRFARGMIGIALLSLVLTQVDKLLLSSLLPLKDFGYYALAAAITAVLYMIVTPVTQAVYPRMVHLTRLQDEADLGSAYHGAAQLVSALAAPAAFVIAFFAEGLVFAWSGDAAVARSTAPILTPLVLGTFLNCLMWMPYHCQLAHGWTGLTLIVNTVAVFILIPTIILLVPRYGAAGAAWIWVCLNAGYLLVGIHFMHLRLMPGEKWRWLLSDVVLPAGAAVLIMPFGRAVQPTEYENRLDWTFLLLAVGICALAASVVAAHRVRASLMITLVRTLRWRYS